MQQLPLPLAEPLISDTGACWVMSCPDEPAWRLAADLARYPHVFLDAQDGTIQVDHPDTVILKDASSEISKVLAPARPRIQRDQDPVDICFPSSSDQSEQRDRSVRDLIAIVLGPDRSTKALPGRYGTRLQQLLSTIRHTDFESLPWTRLNRASDAMRVFGPSAHPLLLALFAREGADAARALTRDAGPKAVQRDVVRTFHMEAARYFQSAGMNSYARQTEKIFHNWDAPDETPLPLFSFESSPTSGRIVYRCAKVSGLRTHVNSPFAAQPAGSSGLPSRRRATEDWPIEETTLRDLVAGASCRKIAAWHTWQRQPDGAFVLNVGLDSSFSIQLGLAGRTGFKQDRYRVSLWGDGCDISTSCADLFVGQSARIEVKAPVGQRSALDLQFADHSNQCLRLRVEVPFDGEEFSKAI
jgi:hypothetical protein